jgi:hypothetical protein
MAMIKILNFWNAGVQRKNNEYHIVDKVQNSFIDALIFDVIDNVVFVVFALYSRMILTKFSETKFSKKSLIFG